MKKLGSRIIVVSYDSGDIGGVTSEWLNDKLDVLNEWGSNVTLITNLSSGLKSRRDLRIIRVPSLSWGDFNNELRKFSLTHENRHVPPHLFVHKVISATLGRLFDYLFLRLAGNRSDGKWSWIFTAGPMILCLSIFSRNLKVLSTGGPSSAHFAALFAKSVFGAKRYVEFQDPFIGSEMQMSKTAMSAMLALEKVVVASSKKTVFVTQKAADQARARNRTKSHKIQALYPGSIVKRPHTEQGGRTGQSEIIFTHLGTLYGTRNLDIMLEALDFLIIERYPNAEKVRIRNRGGFYLENAPEYVARPYFQFLDPLGRMDAITSILDSDYLLLVQHADSRSLETIPFKTYDYVNLQIPIFGIVNNPELETFLLARGSVVCSPLDLQSAVEALKNAIDSAGTNRVKFSSLHTRDQMKLLFED